MISKTPEYIIFSLLCIVMLLIFSPAGSYALNAYNHTGKHKPDIVKNILLFTPSKVINEGAPPVIGLRAALRSALKHYPGILLSGYAYLSSVYAKNQSLHLYYPQISGTAVFSRISTMNPNNNGTYPGGAINYSLNNYSGNINVDYMLYSFGSRRYGYLGSVYRMKMAEARYSLSINKNLYSVVVNFATYFADKELMKADKENMKSNEIQYKAAFEFYKIGSGNLLDAETAKADMETAKAEYINSAYNLKIARLALINSIGLSPLKKYRFVNTLQFKPFRQKLGSLIKTAVKLSPGLKESVYAVKSSEYAVKEAVSGYFPKLNANFSYTGQNASFPLNRNYSVGISVSIPIFNGFLTQNKIAYSKAMLNSNIWSRRLARNNLIYIISNDYYTVLNRYLTVKALKLSANAAMLAYKLALKGYRLGIGSMLGLTDADARYISAQTNYINAKFTYFYQKAKLYSDLGLMREHYIKQENITGFTVKK